MATLATSAATAPRESIAAARFLLLADKLSLDIEKDLPLPPVNDVQMDTRRRLTVHEVHAFLEASSRPDFDASKVDLTIEHNDP